MSGDGRSRRRDLWDDDEFEGTTQPSKASADPEPAAAAPESAAIAAALRDINPDEMTPKQAMEALYGLRALLKP